MVGFGTTGGGGGGKFNFRQRSREAPTPQPMGQMTIEEALLAIMIGAARADGVVRAEESQELRALMARTKTFAAQSASMLSELYDRIDRRFEREDFESIVGPACDAIVAMDAQNRAAGGQSRAESVFAHAVDLVLADRELKPTEAEYISVLAERLRLDSRRGQMIIEVIETKNAF